MSRNAKIVVGLVTGLLLLCVCAAGVATVGFMGMAGTAVAGAVQANPVQVAATADNIADFDLPAGYQPQGSAQVAGFLIVYYSHGDRTRHITLAQAPSWVNVDYGTFASFALQAAPNGPYDRQTRSRIVESSLTTVRGQQVTLVTAEGTNTLGVPYRTVSGVFRGNRGTAIVSVEGPISTWNQAEVDAFIASIR